MERNWFAVVGVGLGFLTLQMADAVLEPWGVFTAVAPLASSAFAIFATQKPPAIPQLMFAHALGAASAQLVAKIGEGVRPVPLPAPTPRAYRAFP